VTDKVPFDIDVALARIEEAVAAYPKAAMFELAELGYSSPFEQLIACLISVRTRDEVSLIAAPRLFDIARTPDALAETPVGRIADALHDVTFGPRKAENIRDIAIRTRDEFGGKLPCDAETLQSFAGIGPKCANLTLGVACGEPVISVDIHVHRVTNRWGYVRAGTPEKTMVALESVLPERHRIDINRLLVPFGKHICTGVRPKCSTCPVLAMCQQVGVTSHR
jgi:endonuclease-3